MLKRVHYEETVRTSSFITLFRTSPVCVPFTKMAVLASSISLG